MSPNAQSFSPTLRSVSGEQHGVRCHHGLQVFAFEAAHHLPHVPQGHKCARLHGHSFQVEVHVTGRIGEISGWVLDFGDIRAAFAPIDDTLDHRYLNEIPGLENPTSENLARWIWQRLSPSLDGPSEIVLRETCSAACRYRGLSPDADG